MKNANFLTSRHSSIGVTYTNLAILNESMLTNFKKKRPGRCEHLKNIQSQINMLLPVFRLTY